jgi:VanZ family protein
MLPTLESGIQSDKISGALGNTAETLIGTGTSEKQEQVDSIKTFIHTYIRKFAHFFEYGLLGVEISLFVYFEYGNMAKKRFQKPFEFKYCFFAVIFCILAAFIDESIQILSGRVPAVLDIWLDLGGFSALFAVVFIILIFFENKAVCAATEAVQDCEII